MGVICIFLTTLMREHGGIALGEYIYPAIQESKREQLYYKWHNQRYLYSVELRLHNFHMYLREVPSASCLGTGWCLLLFG
ncbi:hypothetical protein B0I72DRAFT_138714 [Yarrowia lipolytica]|uniref:Uncharacterized protein n=1 Tax=Yarrowia lipolytica TaxID=4952 RepID=A0A371CCR7_YARLL|nr:hypothetical protein B0I71DRAFT_128088 [Yarrowia lipolytica]RDW32045.1 hypothetical protein B0I72DRAFT_138714 [Yarrowia lipolytica]RDW37995.1 hypothetical protein B0I73DRAFT_134583 [Yarrowia lipolytica]RDW48395.1 hypothetical protein B0I74DRAFT_133820 [Yarrowia lipolytica]RDW54790.1 hypothetical protein B0I75DRAFT_133946 [Yarrowia lipolytica]